VKFNIYVTVRGNGSAASLPALEAADTRNPVECTSLATLLRELGDLLSAHPDFGLGMTVVGVRVVVAEEQPA
jgi:phosphoribosylcarboxyaminoimidazole (NCAIR) mutase